jgi:hypothetical protein
MRAAITDFHRQDIAMAPGADDASIAMSERLNVVCAEFAPTVRAMYPGGEAHRGIQAERGPDMRLGEH